MKRQFLMPSALGIVLMLCLLTVQASLLWGMSQSTASDGQAHITQTDYTYGLPTMLRITDTDVRGSAAQSRDVHVYWDRIVAVLILAWCLCIPMGRWITAYEKRNGEFAGPLRTGWSQPAAVVGYVVGVCAIASAITCAILDRAIGSPSRWRR
jgi:hypothetical protein